MFATIAESAGYNLFMILCLIGTAIWAARKFGWHNSDIGKETKNGIIRQIGRWLK